MVLYLLGGCRRLLDQFLSARPMSQIPGWSFGPLIRDRVGGTYFLCCISFRTRDKICSHQVEKGSKSSFDVGQVAVTPFLSGNHRRI